MTGCWRKTIGLTEVLYGIRDNDDFLYRYSVRHGQENRTMWNSPHWDFLERHTQGGDAWTSDYVLWLRSLARPTEAIAVKVERFQELYRSIVEEGVREPIVVFADGRDYGVSPEDTRPLRNRNDGRYPLYQSQFVNYEILWGHHRAACAAFLGIGQIPVRFYPGLKRRIARRLRRLVAPIVGYGNARAMPR